MCHTKIQIKKVIVNMVQYTSFCDLHPDNGWSLRTHNERNFFFESSLTFPNSFEWICIFMCQSSIHSWQNEVDLKWYVPLSILHPVFLLPNDIYCFHLILTHMLLLAVLCSTRTQQMCTSQRNMPAPGARACCQSFLWGPWNSRPVDSWLASCSVWRVGHEAPWNMMCLIASAWLSLEIIGYVCFSFNLSLSFNNNSWLLLYFKKM